MLLDDRNSCTIDGRFDHAYPNAMVLWDPDLDVALLFNLGCLVVAPPAHNMGMQTEAPIGAGQTAGFCMPESLLLFVSMKWIGPLVNRLREEWDRRDAELEAISNVFDDPRPLAGCYFDPRLQHHNPADYSEGEQDISYLRTLTHPPAGRCAREAPSVTVEHVVCLLPSIAFGTPSMNCREDPRS
jgi:hypothetical protein